MSGDGASAGAGVGLDELVTEAAAAGATDVLLAPGTQVGKLIVRAASETLLSRVVDPAVLRRLSMQIGMRTGAPALLGGGADAPATASVSSFQMPGGLRVRVTCTSSAAGPMVRLRLQAPALLAQAREQFLAGRFGGGEVLRFLHSANGVVFVAGQVAAGKTSALHHLAGSLPPAARPLLVVSEASEFECGDERLRPSEDTAARLRALAPAAVALDEMDETEKLRLALELGRRHLVLATLAAPNVEAALRRIQAARMHSREAEGCVVGVLRVGWRAGGGTELPATVTPCGLTRRPDYAWFAFARHGAGACPCCGASRSPRMRDGDCCGRCGNGSTGPELGLLPADLLEDPQSLDAYHAVERLERAPETHLGGSPWTARPSRN